ncbi:BatD family protein [Saprospira sp. CCB-QB6]|uniref:BatD family protein n=1 Tax=Saprospira sp. CCB-QB6 TaxID=3023936 RepID=UPI0023490CEE|nr:BatD family protein [Saprospira sp. CCB-QB6]WCL82349.1 BatD family protein [Saprospira sp. CCB-QB6]
MKTLFSTLMGLFLALGLQAQMPSISLEIPYDTVGTEDVFQLHYHIQNGGQVDFQQPNFIDFEVIGTSSSSQTSIINGQKSSKTTYSFSLKARYAGYLALPAATALIDGQSYSSPNGSVFVVEGPLRGNGQKGNFFGFSPFSEESPFGQGFNMQPDDFNLDNFNLDQFNFDNFDMQGFGNLSDAKMQELMQRQQELMQRYLQNPDSLLKQLDPQLRNMDQEFEQLFRQMEDQFPGLLGPDSQPQKQPKEQKTYRL